jgi:hypothetical protein
VLTTLYDIVIVLRLLVERLAKNARPPAVRSGRADLKVGERS